MSKQEKVNNLRDERTHIEGIVNQRFNFFIVILSLIIAAVPYLQNLILLRIVFLLGAFIEIVFAYSIARAQRRLDENIKMLIEEGDVIKEIEERANRGYWLIPGRYSVRKWIGYYIPCSVSIVLIICSMILFLSIWFDSIHSWLDIFSHGTENK